MIPRTLQCDRSIIEANEGGGVRKRLLVSEYGEFVAVSGRKDVGRMPYEEKDEDGKDVQNAAAELGCNEVLSLPERLKIGS